MRTVLGAAQDEAAGTMRVRETGGVSRCKLTGAGAQGPLVRIQYRAHRKPWICFGTFERVQGYCLSGCPAPGATSVRARCRRGR